MPLLRVFHCCSRNRKPQQPPAVTGGLRPPVQRPRPSAGGWWRWVSPPRWNRPIKHTRAPPPTQHQDQDSFWFPSRQKVDVLVAVKVSVEHPRLEFSVSNWCPGPYGRLTGGMKCCRSSGPADAMGTFSELSAMTEAKQTNTWGNPNPLTPPPSFPHPLSLSLFQERRRKGTFQPNSYISCAIQQKKKKVLTFLTLTKRKGGLSQWRKHWCFMLFFQKITNDSPPPSFLKLL